MTEDKMVGWHHWLNGHEFEQAPGDSERQGSLVCCSPWRHKEVDTTEWLHKTAFFMVQLSHPYMTTGKNSFDYMTFVSKVMSLLFNMLSRFLIAFLPRRKLFIILWLQSLSAVILEPKKIKSATVSSVFPSICHEVMGPDAMSLVLWMLRFKPAFSLLFHFHQEAL